MRKFLIIAASLVGLGIGASAPAQAQSLHDGQATIDWAHIACAPNWGCETWALGEVVAMQDWIIPILADQCTQGNTSACGEFFTMVTARNYIVAHWTAQHGYA